MVTSRSAQRGRSSVGTNFGPAGRASGGRSCGDASEEEEDMIDSAPAVRPTSRLACQCVPDGSADVVIEIPSWNRNAVKEGH